MSTFLKDILPNRGLLDSMLEQKYIKKEVHPTEPLMILNYTDRATYGHVWNDATKLCRGLIVNTETDEVVARPFPKFFNYQEPDAPAIQADELVYVTDKVDGSLGIKYWCPKAWEWRIATRGSFVSDQAVHATAKLHEIYPAHRHEPALWNPYGQYTLLFEIVYPANRVVLDYGDLDTLVYIGSVEIASGYICPVDAVDTSWAKSTGFGCAEPFPAQTFSKSLQMLPRDNAEGVVLITASEDMPQRVVKFKQSDYVAMAKTMMNLSAKVIWERAGNGETLTDVLYGMPDELHEFIITTYQDLKAQSYIIIHKARDAFRIFNKYLDDIHGPYQWGRKEFAEIASTSEHRNLLFLLLDNRDIEPVVWKQIKPEGEKPFKYRSSDAD